MEVDLFLTIVGSVASILGAAMAFWQARVAKSAAAAAAATKQAIFEKQDIEVLTQVDALAHKAVIAVGKYRSLIPQTTREANLRGRAVLADSSAVRNLVDSVRRSKAELEANVDIDEWCQRITTEIEVFEGSPDMQSRGRAATAIVCLLTDMQARIRKLKRALS